MTKGVPVLTSSVACSLDLVKNQYFSNFLKCIEIPIPYSILFKISSRKCTKIYINRPRRLFQLGTEKLIYPKMTKFVTLVWKVLETWFWCLSPGFGSWEIHWDHCQTPQNDLSGQNGLFWSFRTIKIRFRGLKNTKIVTSVSKVLETWFWCLSQGFYSWEIIWDHFEIDLSGQNGHFGQRKLGKWPNLILDFGV